VPVELLKMLAPADDDLLETYLVTRESLRTKEQGPKLLAPIGRNPPP
jgi:hypothetical protein